MAMSKLQVAWNLPSHHTFWLSSLADAKSMPVQARTCQDHQMKIHPTHAQESRIGNQSRECPTDGQRTNRACSVTRRAGGGWQDGICKLYGVFRQWNHCRQSRPAGLLQEIGWRCTEFLESQLAIEAKQWRSPTHLFELTLGGQRWYHWQGRGSLDWKTSQIRWERSMLFVLWSSRQLKGMTRRHHIIEKHVESSYSGGCWLWNRLEWNWCWCCVNNISPSCAWNASQRYQHLWGKKTPVEVHQYGHNIFKTRLEKLTAGFVAENHSIRHCVLFAPKWVEPADFNKETAARLGLGSIDWLLLLI